jgi:hypothetical protein
MFQAHTYNFHMLTTDRTILPQFLNLDADADADANSFGCKQNL